MGDYLFGSNPSINYAQSPQAQQIYDTLFPLFQGAASGGGWNIPSYNIPSPYNIPSAVAPTSGWYNSISPSVTQGLWEPYQQGANMLGERMGAQGQIGSARGGYSGTAGDAFGKFYSDASKDIGLNAWSMMQPGMQSVWNAQLNQGLGNWSAQLSQNQNMWQQQIQRNMFPYNLMAGMLGGSVPNTVVNPGSQGMVQSMAPYAAYGLLSNWDKIF